MKKGYVMGVDYGTDSVRALVVDAADGREIASAVKVYPRWAAGKYCDPARNRYRQHPLDYVESLVEVVREVVSKLPEGYVANIKGICFDTTASTPVLTDNQGTPLALLPRFAEDPDAMFVLWKDHTAIKEADDINTLAKERPVDYTAYEGGTYSSEWVWSKVLHIVRSNPAVRDAAYSWAEHCDWITGLVTGNTRPETLPRSRCAAGHKAMWNERWGLPSEEFLARLDPALAAMRPHLFEKTFTSDAKAGELDLVWAEKLGLPSGIAVAVGAVDAHLGAVGASVAPGVLVRIIGTSTCDIMVAQDDEIGGRCIEGICGQVDGSVIPGLVGLEAGQSAFGDLYAWFKEFLSWPLNKMPDSPAKEGVLREMLNDLSAEAEKIPASESAPVALDWMNGRRTPYADQSRRGVIAGLTLGTTPPQVYRALVEATAFGSRRIVEHFRGQGVRIDSINAIGGISKKSPFVMQILSDVLRMPIKVIRSEQTCALGSAMFAAVAAGIYASLGEASSAMGSPVEKEYVPDGRNSDIYDRLYEKYLATAAYAENI